MSMDGTGWDSPGHSNVGLNASIHAQTNASHPSQNTTFKEAKKDDGWTIIKKTQHFSIKVIRATYEIKAQAAEVCAKKIADDNDVRFAKLEVINNQQNDNLNDYEIKIWDVPLDVNK
ncbi:hypothetical protein GLOIN_2v1782576 [Rhizophagus irregularis DAOM 181602=DAOM 197198]|uniref:Uncharacterized protein n=1 Tax=Rhizophagus irregularis (strain DAOM 181602 / DAOM 197198 / MUCL 43194) TaxID=747089 RepID=A0A2P4PH90_RHIID|nr:hypothetical protein GLOIN_2v1782576 [Rhizophagus irregularis DAOM 181602=DAOM 197198]POG64707.1 hypothetical protein GLOIN_2v1782576 [Rhizophagus irregularis DAOM 181602=DAOM 197198]GET53594.1 hypothetical protein GLOIN_2v1782576 [Rhizophagus irregularis DAOM 181602=DAOM 197198]|eukprot:XP_025171573.1 hypothetical protein GLOIN_2v1782576 [Rhizophagus irregularis DAOM 181602=DAOM 197198]